MSDPERVRTPSSESQAAVIADISAKARISSAETYPSEMETVADSMLVSSASVMVMEESMTEAASFSVYLPRNIDRFTAIGDG